MTDILVRTITLRCPVDHAFRTFTDRIDLWWPRPHRRFPDGELRLTATALVDLSPAGEEWTMAGVIAREPPHRLALDWFPGSPAAPTSVDIRFEAVPEGTGITITHRALTPAAAAAWPDRVALFARGWDAVLAALTSTLEEH